MVGLGRAPLLPLDLGIFSPPNLRENSPSRTRSLIRRPLLSARDAVLLGRHGGKRARRCSARCKFGLDEEKEEEGGVWANDEHGVIWEAHEIARAVGGQVVRAGLPGSISTDSRTLAAGQWFLALAGPNFDGHDFLPQALERGCAGAVTRDAGSASWPRGLVAAPVDGAAALRGLAAEVRRRFRGPVVGVTGSAGKTTARAMAALALRPLGAIHGTDGNANNHVGVPLTLLRLPSRAAACVLEMGMSRAGELRALARVACPSVRVLLNVGPAHLANFASLEAVAAAKREILTSAAPGDVCVLNADDPLVMGSAISPGIRVVLFGRRRGCNVRIADARPSRGGSAVQITLDLWQDWVEESSWRARIADPQICSKLTENIPGDGLTSTVKSGHGSSQNLHLVSRVEFEICSPGVHLAVNAAAAAAVAVSLGVPFEAACESMSEYSPVGMRAAWEEVGGGIRLVNDAYNTNPMSMEAGLRILGSVEARKVALLGDMLELGSASEKAHVDALLLCRELDVDAIGLVGPSFSEAAAYSGLERQVFMVCRHSHELAASVADILRPGDAVLVKGSRSMKMENVVDAIRAIGREENLHRR